MNHSFFLTPEQYEARCKEDFAFPVKQYQKYRRWVILTYMAGDRGDSGLPETCIEFYQHAKEIGWVKDITEEEEEEILDEPMEWAENLEGHQLNEYIKWVMDDLYLDGGGLNRGRIALDDLCDELSGWSDDAIKAGINEVMEMKFDWKEALA